jgi:hypothetical protein
VTAWAGNITEDADGGYLINHDEATRFAALVTWTRPDVPGAQATSTYAVMEEPGENGAMEYSIKEQTEFLIGRDPEDRAGTEEWSETYTEGTPEPAYPSVEAATTEARRRAQAELTHVMLMWDGQPDTVVAA